MAITKINTPELLDINTTGAKQLPSGTTAQRPTTGLTAGDFRYNTDDNRVEYYDGAAWFQIDDEALPAACTTDTINYPSGTTNTAYYKMSDATDSTLNGYNGTATSVDFNVQGKFGNAGEFNGSNSIITLPNTSSLSQANNFTWSYWVKPNGFTANGTVFRLTSHSYTSHEIRSNGIIFFYWGNAGSITTSSGVITDGVWQHVAITKSSTSGVVIYVNGVSVATSSNTANADTASATNRIGGWDGTNFGFTGSLDQIRIFPTALTAANVTSLYNEVQCVPTIIPSDYFNTVIYSGDGNNRDIDAGLESDFVWIKERSAAGYWHYLFDSIRGGNKPIFSNATNAESVNDSNGYLSSFNNDGFSITSGSLGMISLNGSGKKYVAWTWKAAATTTTIAANTVGNTIASDVRASTESGFSIVKYIGNENANQTVAHGLSQTPEIVFTKQLDGTREWTVPLLSGFSTGNYLVLNDTNTLADDNDRWSSISSSTITIGASPFTNGSGSPYISYFFHSVPGMSDIGSYIGTGANGNNIVTGFRPAFVMIKKSSDTGSWMMQDNKRNPSNPVNSVLQANLSDAELTTASVNIDFNSNGFQIKNTNGDYNTNGGSYIYLAIAEQVYNANGVTANQTNPFNDGSQVAQYEFEDNADDSQPNGYIGKGGTFNGSSSKVVLPDAVSSSIATASAFTISMWFNISGGSGRRFLYFFGRSTYIYLEVESDNTLRAVVNASGGSVIIDDSTVLSNNIWYNAVLTGSNASNLTLYLNGSSVGTTSWDGTFGAAGTVAVNIGNENNALYFNGSIDQVRIYNTALNPNDAWLLYSETSATSSTLDYPASKGAIALYELEGDATMTPSSATYDGAATAVDWVPLYDGTENSMTYAAPSVSAPFLKAGEFNGTSSVITTNMSIGGAFTISFWAKDTLFSTNYYLLATSTGSSTSGIVIGGANGSGTKYSFRLNQTSTGVFNFDSGVVDDSDWHHVVMTYDNTTSANSAKIYINGSLNAQATATGTNTFSHTYNLNIMRDPSNPANYPGKFAVGDLDQLRIFNKALDSGEVTQLYNEPNN